MLDIENKHADVTIIEKIIKGLRKGEQMKVTRCSKPSFSRKVVKCQ